MKDNDGIIYLVLGIVVFGSLAFGVIKIIKRTLNSAPKTEKVEENRKISEQKQKILDLKERERRLREQQEDRMRDFNRR
ncbi:MAG: hypothetical protein KKD07_06970 [Candidatus Omnitrophica bacterium]|nr:hypothetical protein [Candidatus Omnitrophota bacterium]MBU1997574.1 hypothetical protein [Candidatus Omnitrophota bacterium]MBU4334166.1 hypothetical protein [Candidatus Omnitrophota bacterium]